MRVGPHYLGIISYKTLLSDKKVYEFKEIILHQIPAILPRQQFLPASFSVSKSNSKNFYIKLSRKAYIYNTLKLRIFCICTIPVPYFSSRKSYSPVRKQ